MLRPGEASGLRGAAAGDEGEDGELSVLWKRGSVERSISAADMRKLFSERLPFFSSRALKVSLLVHDLRRFRWMEPIWRGSEDAPDTGAGLVAVGVVGVVGVEGGDCC